MTVISKRPITKLYLAEDGQHTKRNVGVCHLYCPKYGKRLLVLGKMEYAHFTMYLQVNNAIKPGQNSWS